MNDLGGPLCAIKPRKLKLRLFEILANSNSILDTLAPENRDYLWTILITVFKTYVLGA